MTCLVTPCSVRSLVTFYLFGPVAPTLVDLNVMVGYFATSRKLGPFKCSSRPSTRVSTDDASMVASICAEAGSLPLAVMVPEVFWELPLYVRDHHVSHGELEVGMRRIDLPGVSMCEDWKRNS
jgi:hypothetical protein